MGDLNSVYPLLGIVILIVLLCRFDGRFTKVEKELDTIKKQMDALLKGQAEMAAGDIKSSEETSEKVVAEVLPKEKTVEEELLVQEPGIVVEAVVTDNLKDASKDIQGDIQEEIIENIPVEDTAQKESLMSPVTVAPVVPKPKKQVNYEKVYRRKPFRKDWYSYICDRGGLLCEVRH